MNCDEVRVLLDDYLRGQIEFRYSMDLEIHLAVCSQCYDECNEMEEVYTLIKTAFAHQPLPRDFAWKVCEDLPAMVEPEDLIEEREIVTTGFRGLFNALTFAQARRRLFGRHSAWGRFRRRVLKWFVGGSYDTFGEWAKDFSKRFATAHPWAVVLLLFVLLAGVSGTIVRHFILLPPKVGNVLDLTGDGIATRLVSQKEKWQSLKEGAAIHVYDMVMTDDAVDLTVGCARWQYSNLCRFTMALRNGGRGAVGCDAAARRDGCRYAVQDQYGSWDHGGIWHQVQPPSLS